MLTFFATCLLLMTNRALATHKKTLSHSRYFYLFFFLGFLDITTHLLHFRADNILTFYILQKIYKQVIQPAIAMHCVHSTQLTQAQYMQWHRQEQGQHIIGPL